MTTYSQRVGATGSGYETTSPGAVELAGAHTRLGNISGEPYWSCYQWVPNIPQGATINSASITLTGQDTYTTGSACKSRVYGDDVDNSAALATTSGNITGRTRTTANTAFNHQSIVLDTTYAITITAVIQEIVDRPGYVSGNTIGIIISDDGSASSEWQQFWDYAGSTTKCALLDVDYTAGGATKAIPLRRRVPQRIYRTRR